MLKNLTSQYRLTYLIGLFISSLLLYGCGGSSSSKDPVIPETPTNLRVLNYASEGIQLTWQAVAGASTYTAYYQLGQSLNTANATSLETTQNQITIDALSNYSTYTFAVSASNAVGSSSLSVSIQERIGIRLTGDQVQGFIATPSDGEVMLEWQALAGATRYLLSYFSGTDSGNSQTLETSNRYQQIDNLENGKNYTFSITAVNPVSRSEPVDIQASPPQAGPIALAEPPELSQTQYFVAVGESISIASTNANSFASDNSGIAQVDSNSGTISGVMRGVTRLIATSSDGSTSQATILVNNRPTANTGYHSWATGYLPSTSEGIFATTINGMNVYAFEGGGFANAYSANDENATKQRLGVGRQFYHSSSIDQTAFAGITVQAPASQVFDYSAATQLLIQVGNAVPVSAHPNSHAIATVRLEGPNDQCDSDLTLTRIGDSNIGAQGFKTHQIDLASGWDCARGTVTGALAELDEVAVLLLGGKDPTADATTQNNHTLLMIGNIGFLGAASDDANTEPSQLLSGSYLEGVIDGSIAQTNANALVYDFRRSEANTTTNETAILLTWTDPTLAGVIQERQAVGRQFGSGAGVDLPPGGRFGLTIKAPNRGRVAITKASELLIQIGNGVGDGVKTHTTFTISLTGGLQTPGDLPGDLNGDYTWQNQCSTDVSIAELRTADPATRQQFRIGDFVIPVSNFTDCSEGTLQGIIDNGVNEVVISVEQGKNPEADMGGNFQTLIQVGWIAFK